MFISWGLIAQTKQISVIREILQAYKNFMIFIGSVFNHDDYFERRQTMPDSSTMIIYKKFPDALTQLFLQNIKGEELIKVSTTECAYTSYNDSTDNDHYITRYVYDGDLNLKYIHKSRYNNYGRLEYEVIEREKGTVTRFYRDGTLIKSWNSEDGFSANIDSVSDFFKEQISGNREVYP